jgi:putative resolvase
MRKKKKIPGMWKLMSVSEASDALGICTKTMRQWCDDGIVKYARTPGGHRKISGQEVFRLRRTKAKRRRISC